MKKIQKSKQSDKIDEFIKKAEDPNWWRIVRDELNQRDIVLTDDQLRILDRLRKGKFANKQIAENDYFVEYEWDDPFPVKSDPPP